MNPPAVWELVVFGLLGAVLGAVVNWGVVALRVHLPRPFGPWHEPPEGSRRNWGARLPIIGWWLLRHEESIHGRFYWVRPLCVELAAVIGLPLFWYWSRLGGGYPEEWVALATGEEWSRVWWSWGLFRFIAGVLLVLAMTLATLIDFDEWLIPDEITLTGTLVALLIACLGFGGPLPIRSDTTTGARTIVQVIPVKDPTPRPLTLASPGDLRWTQAEYWGNRTASLGTAIAIIGVWGFGLVQKVVTLRYGVTKGIALMIASIVRPARRTKGKRKLPPRKMRRDTYWFAAITLIAMALVLVAWARGGAIWETTLSSVVGMGVGAGIVWGIRIVGSYAFGTEAMGFGDVTLMGMIGAFLGWQPALFIFFFSPFTAIVVTGVKYFVSGETQLPYGPYLCLATLVIAVKWQFVWNEMAWYNLAMMDGVLLEFAVLFAAFAGLALVIAGWLRNLRTRDDDVGEADTDG